MDPAGIREVLLLRPYAHNPYQFEALAKVLPYKTRVRAHYSSIPWLPLSEPLPRRVSVHSEGYAGLLQHDCMILAGTDLQSCSERDVQNLRSALERGLPLLICGGAFGLGNSYRLWHDLEAALPARVPAAAPVEVKSRATAVATHPVLRGLPSSFGQVTTIHRVEPGEGATVLLSAGGKPLLVAGERFGGRQLLLAVNDAPGLACDALSGEGFYGHPFYADLMRQALTWLMGVTAPLRVEGLELETGLRLTEPGVHRFHATVGRDGEPAGALLRCAVYAVDDARLMSGGDAVRARKLHEETRPLRAGSQRESFHLEDPLPGRSCGVYEVELSVEMDAPPRSRAKESFAMAAPPAWSNWKGNAVDVRRFFLRFADRRRARVAIPGRTVTLEEGGTWALRVAAEGGAVGELKIIDAQGRKVGTVAGGEGKAGADPADGVELTWATPPLVEGDYTAELSVRTGGGEEEFRFALKAVAPPANEGNFQMVAHLPASPTNEAEMDERIGACLESYGLDTISHGGMQHADALWNAAAPWLEQPYHVRRLRWVDAMVAARGMNLWNDFDTPLTVMATHGYSKDYAPTLPCVHDPGYEAAVRAKVATPLRFQASRAGLLSVEIIDEPHLTPANLCRCELCTRLYRERFGEEMPAWQEVRGDQTLRRWHLFQWLEDYTTRAFAATQRIKRQLAPHVHLHNTAIDRLFSSDFMFNGMHRWAEHGEEIYMACYPWSYLIWRGYEHVPHSQTHWIAAWVRGLATHHGAKKWGVFMELWEHDAPNRWLPPYWSVGQFYALLAAGVTRLDTFLISFGTEVFGISTPRLREFGAEVNKVRPFFPLLPQTQRPRAQLAFVNPWCQWVMDPQPHHLPPDHEGYGYYRRYALPFDKLYPSENRRMLAFELFCRTFPDIDQVDEQLMCEAPMDYRAVIVSDCRFLMRDTMDKLARYVDAGGVLVLDCEPTRDESGQQTGFMNRLTSGTVIETGVVVPGLTYRRFRSGKGAVLHFSASLQDAYGDALDRGKTGVRARLEQTVASLLNKLGLHPRWESSCGDLDAGLRLGTNTALAPVANLGAATLTGRVTLRDLPFPPALAVNLTDGEFLEVVHDQDSMSLQVTLESHHGALLAFFASRPERCELRLDRTSLRAGEPLRYEAALKDAQGRAAAGMFVVDATVTDPTGKQHRNLGGAIVVRDGLAVVEKRIPINAAPGVWTIALMDPMLGLSTRGSVTINRV